MKSNVFIVLQIICAIPFVAIFNSMMPLDQEWYMYLCSGFSATMLSGIFVSAMSNA